MPVRYKVAFRVPIRFTNEVLGPVRFSATHVKGVACHVVPLETTKIISIACR